MRRSAKETTFAAVLRQDEPRVPSRSGTPFRFRQGVTLPECECLAGLRPLPGRTGPPGFGTEADYQIPSITSSKERFHCESSDAKGSASNSVI